MGHNYLYTPQEKKLRGRPVGIDLLSCPLSEGVMRGTIKADGSICLKRFLPRVAAYRDILESAIYSFDPGVEFISWDEASRFCLVSCREPGWRFHQDGAPVHRAASTAAWLHFKRMRCHNGRVWPPISPGLNPVKHIWPWVLRHEGAMFSGREQLRARLQSEFAAVPATQKRCDESRSMRMQAVIATHGGPRVTD